MKLSNLALSTSSILLSSLLLSWTVRAQALDVKTEPLPPQREDVKTPAPPPLVKEPLLQAPLSSELGDMPPPSATPRIAGRGYLTGFDRSQVLFDEPGDGRIWAVGDAYKASFGLEGATYIPFFGSAAPKNFPVRFELRALRAGGEAIAFDAHVLPQRHGNRIVFDRGIVDEIYDLTPTSIEQSFVLERPLAGEVVALAGEVVPLASDLVIDLAVESELARSSDVDGLVLACDSGKVRYGRAYAVDAHAGRTEITSGWDDATIRIVVPAERVAASAWPLSIDPVISTFDVDDEGLYADTNPDVAYDATTDRWMTVYERQFSATDHDVAYRIFTSAHVETAIGTIDTTSVYWAYPKIANNNVTDQFLCVAAAGDPAGGARTIRGRTREAVGVLGLQFTISGSETGDKFAPDVGGDPSLLAPTYYCVVWERAVSSTDHDIHFRLVRTDSTPFGSTVFLENSLGTLDGQPSISKSDGAPPSGYQEWNVVWQRLAAPLDNDLFGAQIRWNGLVDMTPFVIDGSSHSTGAASVSTSTNDTPRHYLVTCMRASAPLGDTDTYGYLCRNWSVLGNVDLTELSGAPISEKQWYPSVDCDGALFVVADQEAPSGSTDYDVYISTFHLADEMGTVSEGHRSLANSATSERVVQVACAGSAGGPPRTTLAVWNAVTSDNVGDIAAGLYDASPFGQFCYPAHWGAFGCPCGNMPIGTLRGCNNSANTGGAVLSATGAVDPDSVVLHASDLLPNALCIFAQGSAVLTDQGTPFGDGMRCVGGQLLRLATKSASMGSASYPVGSDLSITQRSAQMGAPITMGSRRYYYAYYRDPATFACVETFNTTNSLVVQW